MFGINRNVYMMHKNSSSILGALLIRKGNSSLQAIGHCVRIRQTGQVEAEGGPYHPDGMNMSGTLPTPCTYTNAFLDLDKKAMPILSIGRFNI